MSWSGTDVSIRNAETSDYEAICALNLAEVQHTSPMDEARLADLDGLSCYHKVACADGTIAGFLLAMCSGAPYDNENFEWFARRYSQFIYVDRIVVSSAFKGLRVGSSLYDDLFRHARDAGIGFVTCEYNIVPPNEPSRSFHEKFGFEERGTRWAAGGVKRVSMQAAAVRRADVTGSALP